MIPRIVSTSSLISKTLHAGACAHPSMPCGEQNTGRILSRRMRYLPPPVGFAFASAATAGLFLPAPSIAKAAPATLFPSACALASAHLIVKKEMSVLYGQSVGGMW